MQQTPASTEYADEGSLNGGFRILFKELRLDIVAERVRRYDTSSVEEDRLDTSSRGRLMVRNVSEFTDP